jgi:hypothetical protein
MWISEVVTHSLWFSRFMLGLHKRVGETKKRDVPLTIEVVHAVHKLLEAEWRRTADPGLRWKVAEMGT